MLGALVVIHELGHFVTARLASVRVLEFGIGFPPRAKVLRSEGETLWTLNWLPIGGFVRLEGEDGDSRRSALVRAAQSCPTKLVDPRGRRGHEHRPGVRHLLCHRRSGQPDARDRPSARSSRTRPPRRPASSAATTSSTLDGVPFDGFEDPACRRPPRARRPDGRARRRPRRRARRDRSARPSAGRGDHADERRARDRPSDAAIKLRPRLAGTPRSAWRRRGRSRRCALISDGLGKLGRLIVNRPDRGATGLRSDRDRDPGRRRLLAAGAGFTLYLAGILSANLALVNILPFPPLDGGRMLCS